MEFDLPEAYRASCAAIPRLITEASAAGFGQSRDLSDLPSLP